MKRKSENWFKLWVMYVAGVINIALMHYNIYLQVLCAIGLVIIYVIHLRTSWGNLKEKSIKFQICIYVGEIGFMLLNIAFSLANAGPAYIVDLRIILISAILLFPSGIFHFS